VAEREERCMAGYGPKLARLPWSGSSGALASLDRRARVRHTDALSILDGCFTEDPIEGVLRALGLVGRGVAVAHGGARHHFPAWVMHDATGRPSTEVRDLLGKSTVSMGEVRLYAIEGRDRWAERPVNLSTLMRVPVDVEPLIQMLSHIGLVHQLRVVTYDEGRLAGYFGLYLPPGESAFTLSEHAALHALVPALRRWLFTARAIGLHPFDDTGLLTSLELNDRACYLVREDATVVFANARARALPLDGERRRLLLASGRGHVVRLPFRGASLRLVALLREDEPPRGMTGCLRPPRLPASLSRVADGLRRGLSDKEIAAELEMPLATIRTYTSRVLKTLGLSSRRHLMLGGAADRWRGGA
jgi:hypothetical protein